MSRVFSGQAYLLLLFVITGGCAHKIKPVDYKFGLGIPTVSSAYRNVGSAGEELILPIKLRNLSPEYIGLSKRSEKGKARNGLVVEVELIAENQYLTTAAADVSFGLRAGRKLRSIDDAGKSLFFDKHNSVVEDFAQIAPKFIGLREDDVLTAFSLLGNEAQILASFAVDWNLVPKELKTVDSEVELEVRFGFYDTDGEFYRFSEVFRHRARVSFVNGVRGYTDYRPFADGPKSGPFNPPVGELK